MKLFRYLLNLFKSRISDLSIAYKSVTPVNRRWRGMGWGGRGEVVESFSIIIEGYYNKQIPQFQPSFI